MKLLYEGKAKQLYQCENNDEVYVHYKNSATAFNGEKKEEFDKKGILNNTITSLIFEYLEKNGIETHFIRKVNETDQICKHVKIIPLEVITRNINDDHTLALGIVTEEELSYIKNETAKINKLLKEFFLKAGLILVDFKIEFGKTSDGKIILSDEISPDTCRLWDINTMDKLDKDRFRRDMGSVMDAYEEVLRRITSAWN